MKSFEEICDRYYKSKEDLDRDLMLILQRKVDGKNLPSYISGNYASDLRELLRQMGYLEDKVWYDGITYQGKDALKRGWAVRDYSAPMIKEKWKTIREWATLVIAFLGLLLGIWFPRTNPSKAKNELVENTVSTASPNSNILLNFDDITHILFNLNDTTNISIGLKDTTTYVNEIDQAADGTDLQKDSSDTK